MSLCGGCRSIISAFQTSGPVSAPRTWPCFQLQLLGQKGGRRPEEPDVLCPRPPPSPPPPGLFLPDREGDRVRGHARAVLRPAPHLRAQRAAVRNQPLRILPRRRRARSRPGLLEPSGATLPVPQFPCRPHQGSRGPAFGQAGCKRKPCTLPGWCSGPLPCLPLCFLLPALCHHLICCSALGSLPCAPCLICHYVLPALCPWPHLLLSFLLPAPSTALLFTPCPPPALLLCSLFPPPSAAHHTHRLLRAMARPAKQIPGPCDLSTPLLGWGG